MLADTVSENAPSVAISIIIVIRSPVIFVVFVFILFPPNRIDKFVLVGKY